MAIINLGPLELRDQEKHAFLPPINIDKFSSPSPSDCHSPGESFSFLYNHHHPGSGIRMEREVSRKRSSHSPSTSPGWGSMSTPSPVPSTTQIQKLPFLVGGGGGAGAREPEGDGYRLGQVELAFDDVTMLNMMHFGLMEPDDMWSSNRQMSPRIEPGLTMGTNILDQEHHFTHTYPELESSFGPSSPISSSRPLIFELDHQAVQNPGNTGTEEDFMMWPEHGQVARPPPQSTIESPATAFEASLANRQLHKESSLSSSSCRANALSTRIRESDSPMLPWVESHTMPPQHTTRYYEMDDDEDLRYGILDHACAVGCSDSVSNPSPTATSMTDRRWSAATTVHDDVSRRNSSPSGRHHHHHHHHHHQHGQPQQQQQQTRRQKIDHDQVTTRNFRPDSTIESGIHCDAVIAHNEFACSWPNCIDKATGKQKRFKRQEHKKRHEKTVHEKEGSYRCWVPGCTTTAFTRNDNLKSHLRNTHGKKSPNQRNRYVATQDKNSKYYDPDWQGDLTEDGYPIFRRSG